MHASAVGHCRSRLLRGASSGVPCCIAVNNRRHTCFQARVQVICAAASRCHYEVLGVGRTASADEIKRAFRKLALQLHPDVNSSADANDAFKAAKDAYQVLSDPEQRAQYNNSLRRKARSYVSSTTSTWTGGSSGSSRARAWQHQHSRNPFVEYVVYDYDSVEDFEEVNPAGAGFYGWYAQSGSWQSSWDANRKKRQRQQQHQQQTQQQQQQRQAQWQQQQQWEAIGGLLQQLDAVTLGVIAQVYGEKLEDLTSVEELLDLLAGLELLREEGIEPDASMFASRVSDSRSSNSGSRAASAGSKQRTRQSSSSSSAQQASRSSATSSSRSRGQATGTGSQRKPGSTTSSRQRSRSSSTSSMPRFEEMGFDELFAAMQDTSNPKVAKAAREFAKSYHFADPGLAADVDAFLTLEFLAGDWGDDSVFSSLNAVPSSSRWQTESFGYADYAEREKYRAKPGSARDYVRYVTDDDVDDDYGSVRQAINRNFGYVDIDELVMQPGWEFDDSDDDGEVYVGAYWS